MKKQWRSEFNWDGLVSKFSALSYYDQHQVVSAGIAAMMEMLCGFSMGSGGYLPLIDHVAHLTQLMESCHFITGLLDFCNQVRKKRRRNLSTNAYFSSLIFCPNYFCLFSQVLKELPSVDEKLSKRNSPLTAYYVSPLSLHIVGLLRRYYSSLLGESNLPFHQSSLYIYVCMNDSTINVILPKLIFRTKRDSTIFNSFIK